MVIAILTERGRLLCQSCWDARQRECNVFVPVIRAHCARSEAFEVTPGVLACNDCGEFIE